MKYARRTTYEWVRKEQPQAITADLLLGQTSGTALASGVDG